MADESRNHPAAFSRPETSPEFPSLPANPEFDPSTWPNDVFFTIDSQPPSGHAQLPGRRAPNSGHWVPIRAPGYQVVHPHTQQQASNDSHHADAPQFAYPMREGLEASNGPAHMPTPDAHIATTNTRNNEVGTRIGPMVVPQQTRAAPRPRKSTKRRKMFEWGNYPPKDAELPAGTTTVDVVTQFPNHITDDDLEELWRLGSSAKDISKMMPQDTHTNGDGELVSQHHSWIQQKIKRFPQTSATAALAPSETQSQSPRPGTVLPRLASGVLNQGVQTAGPALVRNDAPRRSGAELCKLVLRHHPFDSQEDTALAARMSIMLAKTYKESNSTDQGHHEWGVLYEYIMRVMEYHRELVMRKLRRTSPDAEVDECHARCYDERSLALITRWRVGSFVRCLFGPHAVCQLYGIIRLIIEVPTEKSSPKSKPGRVIYNCKHPNVTGWRIMARVLYTLIETTDTLVKGTTAYNGTPGLISAVQPYPTMLQNMPVGKSRSETLPLAHGSSYALPPGASHPSARLLGGIEEAAQIDPQLLDTPQGPLPSPGGLQRGTVWTSHPVRDQTPERFEHDLSRAAWTPDPFRQQSLRRKQGDLPETNLPAEPVAEEVREPLDSEWPGATLVDPRLLAPRQTSSQNRSRSHQRELWTQEPVADEEGEQLLQSDLPTAKLAEEPVVQKTPQSLENHWPWTPLADVRIGSSGPVIRAPDFTSQGALGIPRPQTYWNQKEENLLPHMFDDTPRDLLFSSLPANMFVNPQDTYLHRMLPTSSPADVQSLGFDLDGLDPEQSDGEWFDEWSLPKDYLLQGESSANTSNDFARQTLQESEELDTMFASNNE